MTTDRLFVILLVMLIPMTGCFGAVGDADAQDETTPVVPSNSGEVIEKFTTGGLIDINTSIIDDYKLYFEPYIFNTTAGELVNVHYFMHRGADDGVGIRTTCDDGTTHIVGYIVDLRNLWGSHANCSHAIEWIPSNGYSKELREEYQTGEWTMGWSLVYSIESVTVV